MTEHDVFGDSEYGDQHEVLVDHANAGRHGVAGTLEFVNDTVQQDFALVRGIQAVEDVHER